MSKDTGEADVPLPLCACAGAARRPGVRASLPGMEWGGGRLAEAGRAADEAGAERTPRHARRSRGLQPGARVGVRRTCKGVAGCVRRWPCPLNGFGGRSGVDGLGDCCALPVFFFSCRNSCTGQEDGRGLLASASLPFFLHFSSLPIYIKFSFLSFSTYGRLENEWRNMLFSMMLTFGVYR